MYHVNGALITVLLFASMVLAIEAGYRVGYRAAGTAGDAFKSHINAVAGALLGILALLLGFTLSLSLQRYDNRSEAVVAEANAIGTTYLRSHLLPVGPRGETQKLLREYVDARIAGDVALDRAPDRAKLLAGSERVQEALWDQARAAAALEPNPVTTGLFIQALNEMFDSYGSRNAALDRHVPELVLWLLYATFVMTGIVVGYASGIAGHRASFVTYIMVALIVVLVFVILDLDRPRRGLIQVSQQSMLDLQAALRADARKPLQIVNPPATGVDRR